MINDEQHLSKNPIPYYPHKFRRLLSHQSYFRGMQITIDDLVPFPVIVDRLSS